MLVVEGRDSRARHICDRGHAVIFGHRLVTRIDDAPIRRRGTDNGPQHPEGLFEWHTDLGIVRIHQRVRSRLDLGHSRDATADVEKRLAEAVSASQDHHLAVLLDHVQELLEGGGAGEVGR